MKWLRISAAFLACHLIAAMCSPLWPSTTIRLSERHYLQLISTSLDMYLRVLPFLALSVIAIAWFYRKHSTLALSVGVVLSIPGIFLTGYLGIFLLILSATPMLTSVLTHQRRKNNTPQT